MKKQHREHKNEMGPIFKVEQPQQKKQLAKNHPGGLALSRMLKKQEK